MRKTTGCIGCVASGLAAVLLAAAGARADLGPRPDLGVAALDANSGSVLWEAWQATDIPAQAAEDVRNAATRLLAAKPEDSPARQEGGLLWLDWPARIDPNHAVQMMPDGEQCTLTLNEWTDGKPGSRIAAVTLPAVYGQPGGLFEDLLVVQTRENTLYAFKAEAARGQWKPAWTFDVLLKSPPGPKGRLFYHPTAQATKDGLLWLATSDRVTALDKLGQVKFDLKLARPEPIGWESPPPRIDFRKDRLYCMYPGSVVVVDRRTAKVLWRQDTARFGLLSNFAEAGGLVLLHVGSDCPRVISNTLGGSVVAGHRLGEITPSRVAAAAVLLHAYGDGYPRAAVRGMMNKYAGTQIAEAQKAAAVLRQALENWPARRDRARLAKACVDALAAEARKGQSCSPAAERLQTWAVLQELVFGRTPNVYGDAAVPATEWHERPLDLPPASLRMLMQQCRTTLATGPEAEKPFAASLLLSDCVGGGQVRQSEIEELLTMPDAGVWQWAATRLARDGKRDRLIELTARRSIEDRVAVLWILSGRMPKVITPAEDAFWLACLRAETPKTAYAARMAWGPAGPAPEAFRGPIAAYLNKEIADPKVLVNSQAQYDMEAALDILDRWNRTQDVELLRKYLSHPCVTEGYRPTSDGAGRKFKVFSTRQRVAAMLKRRGVAIPPDVVFEEPWDK